MFNFEANILDPRARERKQCFGEMPWKSLLHVNIFLLGPESGSQIDCESSILNDS